MAKPFRVNVTTWKLNGRCHTPDGNRVKKDTPGAVRVDYGPSKTCYGKVKLPNGDPRRVKLATDKTASKQILAKLVVDAKLAEHDLDGGRFAEHARRPLTEHLADYRACLTDKGNTAKYIATTKARIQATLDAGELVLIADVQPAAVIGAIGELRRPAAKGDGGRRKRKRLSIATANHYLGAIGSFTKWLCENRRIPSDPLAGLDNLENAATDIRRERREFTLDELRALIDCTLRSPRTFRGQTGPARAAIYACAVGTGLRAAELHSLTPEAFRLNADPPEVIVSASNAKNRKQAAQPITPDLADMLRGFIAGKPAGRPVWAGGWSTRSARMIRADMSKAREAWLSAAPNPQERERREGTDFLIYRNRGGLYADFHALRHTYISQIVRSGASPKAMQTLARHSTSRLTLDRYAHVGLFDLTAAVNTLPNLAAAPGPAESAARVLAATGTDDPRLDRALTKTERIRAISGDNLRINSSAGTDENPQENQRFLGDSAERPLPDSNRGWWICNPPENRVIRREKPRPPPCPVRKSPPQTTPT